MVPSVVEALWLVVVEVLWELVVTDVIAVQLEFTADPVKPASSSASVWFVEEYVLPLIAARPPGAYAVTPVFSLKYIYPSWWFHFA